MIDANPDASRTEAHRTKPPALDVVANCLLRATNICRGLLHGEIVVWEFGCIHGRSPLLDEGSRDAKNGKGTLELRLQEPKFPSLCRLCTSRDMYLCRPSLPQYGGDNRTIPDCLTQCQRAQLKEKPSPILLMRVWLRLVGWMYRRAASGLASPRSACTSATFAPRL